MGLTIAVAACATNPPPRKPMDATTRLENGKRM
jgi:hypothetical protein